MTLPVVSKHNTFRVKQFIATLEITSKKYKTNDESQHLPDDFGIPLSDAGATFNICITSAKVKLFKHSRARLGLGGGLVSTITRFVSNCLILSLQVIFVTHHFTSQYLLLPRAL